jgi:hypothetical protein
MLTGGHPCEHGRTGERSNLCKNCTSSKGRKTTVCIYQDAGNECDKLVGRDKMILLFPLFFSLPLNRERSGEGLPHFSSKSFGVLQIICVF